MHASRTDHSLGQKLSRGYDNHDNRCGYGYDFSGMAFSVTEKPGRDNADSCEKEVGECPGYQRVEKQKPKEQYEYQDGTFLKNSLTKAHGSGSLSQQRTCACPYHNFGKTGII